MYYDDFGLQYLLDLHGTQFTREDGYWWKIEAYPVEATSVRPHGIRYNLTLHNRYNKRVFGLDNAHGVKLPKKGYFSGKTDWDHVHLTSYDKGHPYDFHSAEQLVEDFFAAVDRVINELEGGSK